MRTTLLKFLSCAALALAMSNSPANAQLQLLNFKERKHKSLRLDAVNKARLIVICMIEFDTDYGRFPDTETAKALSKQVEDGVKVSADSANDCFAQFLAADYIDPEDVSLFSLKDVKEPAEGPKKIEDCFFSYVAGSNTASPGSRPLLVAPLIKGKKTFDPEPLGGKAVVAFIDGSVRILDIDEQGRVMLNGMDLFDPKQDFWGEDHKTTVKWPEE